MNAAFTFIAGLMFLALAIDISARGLSNLLVVGMFFVALFLMVPLTLMQMPDDAFLGRALGRKRDN